jgi:hypothetical protein
MGIFCKIGDGFNERPVTSFVDCFCLLGGKLQDHMTFPFKKTIVIAYGHRILHSGVHLSMGSGDDVIEK